MDHLKAYWVKPMYQTIRLVKDIDEPWSDENGGEINPSWFQANYEGACMFSKMEIGRGCWVKIWLYHNDLLGMFKNKRTRDEFAFWVDPTWLVELPLS